MWPIVHSWHIIRQLTAYAGKALSYSHYVGLECVAAYGLITQFVTVGIYRIHAVVENLCHPLGVVDSQTHECQDAQVAVEQLPIRRRNPMFRAQKFIHPFYECRIYMQECIIKNRIKLLTLLFDEFPRFRQLLKLIDLP